jgi:DNA-binding NtrC family response regulator
MVPSLSERREDIPQLIEHFLTRFSSNGKYLARRMSPEAEDLLLNYSWPGNVRELENVVERLVVTGRNETVQPDDLPLEIRAHNGISLRPKRERRRTVSDDLFKKIVDDRESFWTVVYPRYMQREITKSQVREVVRKGLEQSRGNYKIVARMFNMDESEYKRFLNFLRKHDCQLPFKDYRQ